MEKQYRNILVPVDGSQNAEKALARAIEIAKQNDSRVEVLNVIDVKQFTTNFGGVMSGTGDMIYSSFEYIQDYLTKLKDRFAKEGFTNLGIHARFGSPRVVITQDFPADYPIDLIVIGKTGLSAVERLLMGAVTDSVIRMAKCDVLVV
ncbi:universal stress protein [Liquorilactobacillus satsumensis]|nr:universal stress protein [Liquorilactobacillus satsumensis]MCC7666684.1 universal stress protein [Liquorilactobacillus satsumensis]MCP9312696.1 universal stress protein [Liquorilactobacillus satsumensis]MCP9327525.1 universal stress protein [Liquorilactobacillus satsumensis]MCP9357561.1 universal stress protein [Liquorilactobacillus satsumensis]MCP9359882.1 universal stress protein [Liquorilactobacillus satsumensis]